MHKFWRAITTPCMSLLSFVVITLLAAIFTSAWHDYRDDGPSVRITCETLGGTNCTHEITVTAP